jgi:hypothetical protein
MASPLFDELHLKLSRKVYDPVASASTDGSELTSALRTDYLNRASKFIQSLLWTTKRDFVELYLSGLVKTQAFTFSSSGVAIASDFSFWLAAQKDSPIRKLMWIEPSRKIELDMAVNPSLTNVFTILAGKIYAYQQGVVLSSGAGTLYYVQNDQRTQAGDTSDISIDPLWYEVLIDLAASYHFSDKGKLDFEQASIQRTAMVLKNISA